MELVFECGLMVALVVRLFGHCRQAFYQSKADIEKEVEQEKKVSYHRCLLAQDCRLGTCPDTPCSHQHRGLEDGYRTGCGNVRDRIPQGAYSPFRPWSTVLLRCICSLASSLRYQHIHDGGLQAYGQCHRRAYQRYNKGGEHLPSEEAAVV